MYSDSVRQGAMKIATQGAKLGSPFRECRFFRASHPKKGRKSGHSTRDLAAHGLGVLHRGLGKSASKASIVRSSRLFRSDVGRLGDGAVEQAFEAGELCVAGEGFGRGARGFRAVELESAFGELPGAVDDEHRRDEQEDRDDRAGRLAIGAGAGSLVGLGHAPTLPTPAPIVKRLSRATAERFRTGRGMWQKSPV
jgi:hypothetical protein